MWSNTDEFKAVGLEYESTGSYCKFQKDSRAYKDFWIEQRKRSLDGYHIGRDYITGYHYWYLNFCPIKQVIPTPDKEGKIVYNEDGSVQGTEVVRTPLFWDTDVEYFYYLDEAEKDSKHAVVIKKRRFGASYKGGAMLTRNYYCLPGSRSYAIAAEKDFLLKDGVLSKAHDIMSHVDEHTAFAKKREYKNLPLHRRASYRWTTEKGVEIEKGYLSEIIGYTTKNDIQKIRGISGKLILFEEAGKFPNLLTAWNIAKNSMKQGNKTRGMMLAFGTAGTNEGDFGGLSELFTRPKGYHIFPKDNIYSEKATDSQVGLFVPAYLSLDGFYDKDGNSDVEGAKKYLLDERKKVLEHTKDSLAFKKHCAELPFTVEEATMQIEGSIFPSHDLLGVLARLELDYKVQKYEKTLSKGFFEIDQDGKPEFKEDKGARILYNFPTKLEDNKNAPCILYEQPYKDGNGDIPYGLHVAGIDSYDLETGVSLGSCFIINKVTNRIVAEYTARTSNPDDFYEQVKRMLMYYNARALYENGNKGIFTYFEYHSGLYLLHEEPTLIKEIIKNPGVSRKYGVRMTKEVKRHAEMLTYQWLIKTNDHEKNLKNYHKVRSIGLLKELIAYNQDINCDRVSSIFCLVLQLEEEGRYKPVTEDSDRVQPMMNRGFFGKSMRSKPGETKASWIQNFNLIELKNPRNPN